MTIWEVLEILLGANCGEKFHELEHDETTSVNSSMRILSCTLIDRIECDETSCINKNDVLFLGFPTNFYGVWEQHRRSMVSLAIIWCWSAKFAAHKRSSSS